MRAEFDHIVVGGGASGCVVAAELVARGDRKVLLIEGGHSHRHPLIDMPPGIFKLIAGNKYMTVHQTAPQDQLDGRVHDIPQGNVLGGGSSVNAQVYMRGRPSDYEAWDSALANNADAVLGSVTAHYHDSAPKWLVRADPMSKCWAPAGTRMNTGSTCNALVKRERLDKLEMYFNPELGRAGCDDADLFARLAHSGAVILMCPSARVSEDVPPSRADIEYLRRRALRVGQSYARIIKPYKSPLAVANFHIQALLRWLILWAIEPPMRLIRPDLSLRLRLVRWRNSGKLREFMGLHLIEMY